MIESVNNIFKRMNEIQNGAKNMGSNFKPEMVKEFENMYKDSISKSEDSAKIKTEEITHPKLVQKTVDYYKDFSSYENNEKIINAVKNASQKYGVSEDLIYSVIKVESNYNDKSVSRAGAMGLMQLMPKTALDLGVEKPFDIDQNVEGGTKYLREMMDKYKGNLDKTLAAYNAGPGKVDEADGIPDIKETQDYVKLVKNNLSKWGMK